MGRSGVGVAGWGSCLWRGQQIPPASTSLRSVSGVGMTRNDKEQGGFEGAGVVSGFAQAWEVTSDAAFHRPDSLEFCHSERAGFSPESLP